MWVGSICGIEGWPTNTGSSLLMEHPVPGNSKLVRMMRRGGVTKILYGQYLHDCNLRSSGQHATCREQVSRRYEDMKYRHRMYCGSFDSGYLGRIFSYDSNKLTVKLGARKCMEVVMGCGGPRGGLETYATVFWTTKDQTVPDQLQLQARQRH